MLIELRVFMSSEDIDGIRNLQLYTTFLYVVFRIVISISLSSNTTLNFLTTAVLELSE